MRQLLTADLLSNTVQILVFSNKEFALNSSRNRERVNYVTQTQRKTSKQVHCQGKKITCSNTVNCGMHSPLEIVATHKFLSTAAGSKLSASSIKSFNTCWTPEYSSDDGKDFTCTYSFSVLQMAAYIQSTWKKHH